MPFTFSHPAIVLPLTFKRLKLSATALIIGSMVPDFEYFIRMTDHSRYSHTIAGLFWFDLPMGLLICFVYHGVVKDQLFNNLPPFLKQRVIVYKDFQWTKYFFKNWLVVCVCLVVGAASHILWDAFTHESLSFVEKDPELSTVMRLGRVNLAGYRFLQLSSSLTGLLVVILAIISLKKAPFDKTIDYRYWIIVGLIISTVMLMRTIAGMNFHDHRQVLVSFISSSIIALILAPIILNEEERPGADFYRKTTDKNAIGE